MRISGKLKLVAAAVAALAGIALFTNHQVSKAALLHRLNADHFKYTIQLTELLGAEKFATSHTELLRVEHVVRAIREQPRKCLATLSPFDQVLMQLIGAQEAIRLCHDDVAIADEALLAIDRYRRGALPPAALVEVLNRADGVFMRHSFAFIDPVERTGDFVTRSMGALALLMSIAVAGLVMLTARSVVKPLQQLTGSVEALKRGEVVGRLAAAGRNDELGALAQTMDGLRHLAHELSASKAALESSNRALLAEREGLERRVSERTADLQAALVDAQAASAAKTQFLAAMSHELRTPLSAIIGYSEMLQEAAEADAREGDAADLERVLRAARYLLGLINDVLDIAKVEAGKLVIERKEVDLQELLREALDNVRPQAQLNRNGLRLTCQATPQRICTDPSKLQQSLLNLLSNAVKFTTDGEVMLSVWADADLLHFEVLDTGCGISAETLARLFRPFEQGDQSNTRAYGGTGLGLAITKRFALALGGDVTVQSTPGAGSRFCLSVALHPAEPAFAEDRHALHA